jgi:MFS family permease
VMALYMAIFMGGTPIGSPIIGWIGEEFGARYTILLGSVVSILTALVAVLWVQYSRGVRISYAWQDRRPRLLVSTRRQASGLAQAEAEAEDAKSAA